MIAATSQASGRPLISVIIAVRNGALTLQRALDSVYGQTYGSVEVIVIDGASSDGTQLILERNANHIAHWASERDTGIFQAWNKALDHVRGDWICFLGADDRYHATDVFATIMGAIVGDHGEHRVVYGLLDFVRLDGTVDRSRGGPWDEARRSGFRRGKMIPHPSTFHRRDLFVEHGRFDESFRIAGDYEFLLRELLDHDPLFVPVLVVDMDVGGLSDRPSSRYQVLREVHRARYMHGLVPTPGWRSRRLIRTLVSTWVARNVRDR